MKQETRNSECDLPTGKELVDGITIHDSVAPPLPGGARGSSMALLFAASYPERVRALVLYAPIAKTVRSADWPYGKTEEEQRAFYTRFTTEMGSGRNLDLQGPTHDERFARWWARF